MIGSDMVPMMKGTVLERELGGKRRGHLDARSHAIDKKNRETNLLATVEYDQRRNRDHGVFGGLDLECSCHHEE